MQDDLENKCGGANLKKEKMYKTAIFRGVKLHNNDMKTIERILKKDYH